MARMCVCFNLTSSGRLVRDVAAVLMVVVQGVCCILVPMAQVSTGMIRKFTGCLDIPLSMWEAAAAPESMLCFLAASQLRIILAMAKHHSQWVWCVETYTQQHLPIVEEGGQVSCAL